jgi:hypothetical protein
MSQEVIERFYNPLAAGEVWLMSEVGCEQRV